jgi:RNA polymerase sigma-70 factor, ECF subfamily
LTDYISVSPDRNPKVSMKPKKEFKDSESCIRPMEERQWVRKIREDGDREVFERMFRNYYKRLHGFAFSYVKRRECAEDIVQTVFLRIWTNRTSWDPPGKVRHYLFTAVRNEALNFLKHQKVQADSEAEITETFRELKERTFYEETPESEELKKAIQKEIDQLPKSCREIYLLNRRSGLTYSEIADHLGISINTVGTQMGRALKTLRENLSDYLPIILSSGLLF